MFRFVLFGGDDSFVRDIVCVCVCVWGGEARVMLALSDVRKQIMRQISVHHTDEITSDCRKCHNDDLLNLYGTRNGVEISKCIGM